MIISPLYLTFSPSLSLDPPKNTSVLARPSSVVDAGRPLTLTCSSQANPAVDNFTWHRLALDGGSVQCQHHKHPDICLKRCTQPFLSGCIHLSKTSVSLSVLHAAWGTRSGPVFTFSEVGPGESGRYYCEARNRIGAHSSPVLTVRVRGTEACIDHYLFTTPHYVECFLLLFIRFYWDFIVLCNVSFAVVFLHCVSHRSNLVWMYSISSVVVWSFFPLVWSWWLLLFRSSIDSNLLLQLLQKSQCINFCEPEDLTCIPSSFFPLKCGVLLPNNNGVLILASRLHEHYEPMKVSVLHI